MSSRRLFDPTIDYYAILRVESTATREEITRSYRQLMRRTHPDRFTKPAEQQLAGERARELNAAYAVLSRADLRRDYDLATRDQQVARTMRHRYGTPRSASGRRQPAYTQNRAAARPRPPIRTKPVQKSSYSKAIRQLLGMFIFVTLALMLIIVAVIVAFAGLRILIG